MKVPVLNMAGEEVNTIELPASIFEADVNRGLMHQALVRQMANARLGTHKTKGAVEVNQTNAQNLSSERDRKCPPWQPARADICRWWCRSWAPSAQIYQTDAAKNAPRRVAFCLIGESR